jgi:predicted transcriptional regulator
LHFDKIEKFYLIYKIYMKIKEIAKLLDATFITGEQLAESEIDFAFASDLMSDVLTLKQADRILLITGLCNIQTIRTAEMANVEVVLFVRNKNVTNEMIEIAEEENMVLLQCKYSMFRAVGMLYVQGLQPVY